MLPSPGPDIDFYVDSITNPTDRPTDRRLIANSGSLHKFDNSCTARIFSLHDFQTILNAKDYACRGLCMHNLKIDLPPDPGPVRGARPKCGGEGRDRKKSHWPLILSRQ